MSGIDEQFQGTLKCFECGKEPSYWILKTSFSGDDIFSRSVIAWLFSDDYAINSAKEYYQGKHVGLGDKHHDVEITEFTADDIKLVETICCKKKYHMGPMFNEVKKAVDYWLSREGFGSERRR